MTKGWCPVHDRIVEGRGGACPECGTPLVDLTARPRADGESRLVVEEEEEEEKPPPSPPSEAPAPAETSLWPEIRLPERFFGQDSIAVGPAAIAAILVSAVVASFLVGVAIPRGGREERDAPAVAAVRSDHSVRQAQTGAGLRIVLDRFSQRGRRVHARFLISEDAPIPIGNIELANVIPVISLGTEADLVSMEVHPTTNGFILDGEVVDRPNIVVTGLHIQDLSVGLGTHPEGADFSVDLSRVWPVSRAESSRATTLNVTHRSDDGRVFRLRGIVAWPDRIEARIDVTGIRPSWEYDEQYLLIAVPPDDPPHEGEPLTDGSTTHVFFRDVANEARRGLLSVRSVRVILRGDWRWVFR